MQPSDLTTAGPEADASGAVDPMIAAVRAYRTGISRFEAECPDGSDEEWDALAATTWIPPFDRLAYQTPPTLTLQGVEAAVRLLNYEWQHHEDTEMAAGVIKSLVAFFDREGGRHDG